MPITDKQVTENKVKFIFDTLEASGVSITAFSRLVNISRTALHGWRNGQKGYDMLRLNVAYNYALRLDRAVKDGKLPLDGLYEVDEQLSELRRIVAAANGAMRNDS